MEFDYSSLYDIHEGLPPTDSSYWWIWLLLGILAFIGLVYLFKRIYPVLVAYSQLKKISINDAAFMLKINYWLKKSCLINFKRKEFAKLYSNAWLTFLDNYGNTNFSSFKNFWDSAIYNSAETNVSIQDKKLVLKECKRWLRSNLRRRIWGR